MDTPRTPLELDEINAAVMGVNSGLRENLPPEKAFEEEAEGDTEEVDEIPSALSQLENPDEVLSTLTERARFAADYRRPFEEEWHRCVLAMFQVLHTEKESSWQSQRYMPLILANVETALSVILTVVLDSDKLARLISRTPQGADNARNLEALLEWQNKGPCKTDRALAESEWWALVTGTGVIDTGWEQVIEDRMVPVVDVHPATGEKRKVIAPRRVTVKDHPRTKALNPLDVYLCPHSGYGKDHDWVFIRCRTTLGEIRRSAGKGHIDKAAFDRWVSDTNPTDGPTKWNGRSWDNILGPHLWDTWLDEIGRNNVGGNQLDDSKDKMVEDKLVEVLIYRSRDEIVTLGDDKHILGYSKNPHLHRQVGIVTRPFIPVYGCPYGRSLAGLLLGHQELLNMNVNLFHDVSMISAMRPIIVDRSLTSSLDEEFILEPSSIIRARMNAKDAVIPLDIPAPTNLFMLWDQHLRKDADDTSGFTEQARGIAPANSPTATEFSGVQANIQNRLKIHVRRLRWFIEDVVSLMVQLNQQYYDQKEVVALNGEGGLQYTEIEPWAIIGEVQVVPTTSPRYANQDLHVQRMIQLVQVIMPAMTGQMPLTAGLSRFLRDILRAANVDNADQLIPMPSDQVRSPDAENIAMLNGVTVDPSIAEVVNGMGMQHIQSHSIFLQQLSQDPNVSPQVLANLRDHLNKHMQLEQQFGMMAAQMAGQPAPQGAPAPGGGVPNVQPEGDLTRQGATASGTAAGGGGIPGLAAPGPAEPMGRPSGRVKPNE